MTKLLRLLVLLALTAVTWVSCASTPIPSSIHTANQPDHFRLTLDLRDGSRVIGQSLADSFQFQSETLGKLDLSLSKIRLIESLTGTNRVRLTMANGDVLSAAFAMADVRVATLFGEIKLPADAIKNLRVSSVLPKSLNDGLIGLWSGGGRGVDSIGGNNGTFRNVTFIGGVTGKAFTFSPDSFPPGTWVGLQIPDQPAFALTNAMSIESWIRPRGDGYIILCRGDHRPGFDPYTLSMQHNHDLEFAISDNDNTAAKVDVDIPYTQWTHVVATLDGEAGALSLYTNGVLAAETRTSIRPLGELISELSPGLGIGNINDGGNNFPFVGDIDHVALYNRALTADEIRVLYEKDAGNATGQAGLLPTPFSFNPRERFEKY